MSEVLKREQILVAEEMCSFSREFGYCIIPATRKQGASTQKEAESKKKENVSQRNKFLELFLC